MLEQGDMSRQRRLGKPQVSRSLVDAAEFGNVQEELDKAGFHGRLRKSGWSLSDRQAKHNVVMQYSDNLHRT